MVARAALPLTAADLQTQPHGTGQQHQRAPVLVAQPHGATAARAALPRRIQHTLPIRSGPRRQPGHLVPPETVKALLPQRTTPASFASLAKKSLLTLGRGTGGRGLTEPVPEGRAFPAQRLQLVHAARHLLR